MAASSRQRSRLRAGAAVQLSALNERLHDLYESHYSYPVVHYFQFREPFYAMSHVAGLIADTASLSLTVIDQKQYRNIAGSAAVSESFGSSTYMLARLSVLFLPAAFRPAAMPGASVGDEVLHWGTRLRAAAERLDRAGFANKEDQSRAAGG